MEVPNSLLKMIANLETARDTLLPTPRNSQREDVDYTIVLDAISKLVESREIIRSFSGPLNIENALIGICEDAYVRWQTIYPDLFSGVSGEFWTAIRQLATTASEISAQVREYTPDEDSPKLTGKGLGRTVSNSTAIELIEKLEKELSDAEEKNRALDETIKITIAELNAAKNVHATLMAQAVNTVATDQAKLFGALRGRKFNASAGWLTFTGIFFLALVISAFCFMTSEQNTVIYTTNYQLLGMRLFLLSSLTYAMFFCARAFRANSEAAYNLEQKEAALGSFAFLAKASEGDLDLQKHILMKAADAIYSIHDSGLVDGKSDTENLSPLVTLLSKKDS